MCRTIGFEPEVDAMVVRSDLSTGAVSTVSGDAEELN